jgi:uroporphyrinogen decarboxylase
VRFSAFIYDTSGKTTGGFEERIMDHIERFYATIERRKVDRPCSWLGIPDTRAYPNLFSYFQVNSIHELIVQLDDDIVPVEMPYHSPTSNAIYMAFAFAKKGIIDEAHRTLTAPGFFEDMTDPARVDDFDWPDPAKYIDPAECLQVVEQVPPGRVVLGVIWSAHFQDACAAFGMENALLQMYTAPEMFRAVIGRIEQFYLRANEIFFEATRGKLHAILIGNDFGGQRGLMLAPEKIREFAFPGTRHFIQQAKSYGVKVIHHSCGGIRDIIPDLIEMGADAINPIQALAAGMEPKGLKRDFGDQVAFCGGVDAQNLMVNGTPEQVRQKVRELKKIFPTGLILSPSHETILFDTPPANVEAMFQAIQEK